MDIHFEIWQNYLYSLIVLFNNVIIFLIRIINNIIINNNKDVT